MTAISYNITYRHVIVVDNPLKLKTKLEAKRLELRNKIVIKPGL